MLSPNSLFWVLVRPQIVRFSPNFACLKKCFNWRSIWRSSSSNIEAICIPEDFSFAGANFLFSEDYCVVLSSGICRCHLVVVLFIKFQILEGFSVSNPAV
jgi:hypothetical protein